ncbi:ribonuclease R family protein [Melittangium boletus]|uniref:3'-to-5' exoribonuclease RNase R n=1 Tax=Melittangium boletus DSM 14713 TaxID=1294270 RepID=A0A250IN80_9BACT|nr:RNB domain-containing ribonuclease [Melittangium boletus]ATB32710.1 3'-to-5' exoribonuclease RNase R [Melittangium boletus DSM 14713]
MDSSLSPRTVTGHVDVHPRGFGFLLVRSSGADPGLSAFIPPAELAPYLTDDVVSATVSRAEDGRWSASGLSLVKRPRQEVFGEVVLRDSRVFLQPDREVGRGDWPLETQGTELRAGDAVVAQVDTGTLRLLRRFEPGVDLSLERLLVRHGLRRDFGPEARAEVPALLARPHALGSRRDLRGVPTVTVDSSSTRVIDDALSILPAGGDGALRVFVSIADAAEFVPEGSALEREARERATNAYLADAMLPMLPEELSADWISLKPGEDRSCLTVELRLDPEGRITSVDVYESLLRSWARLSYTEVAAWLDTGEFSAPMAPVREAMPWLRAAAARLAVARAGRGGIEMTRDEAFFTFDDVTGEVSGIETVRPTSAHALVERFMVAANEAIAGWLVERGVPALFRVQEGPDPRRVADLEVFARQSGFAPAMGRAPTPLALAAFDRQISGTPEEPALRAVLRRALGSSRYTVVPAPHFGLAAPAYVHFTSPIRRYADLAVHRALKHYLRGRRDFLHEDPDVERLAVHLNERTRATQRAEKERQRLLEARVMAAHVGREFTGRVTRVRGSGLLVQLDSPLVEGLLPTDSLPGGPYTPDERETALVGSARTFPLGMPLRVRVASTDEGLGRVELALAG